jgi:Avidin family
MSPPANLTPSEEASRLEGVVLSRRRRISLSTEVIMSRVLRLISVAVVVASSGLTAAQSPTLPSQVPTQPPTTTIPGPGQPLPSAAPAATLADAAQTIPAGRSTWRSQDGSVVDITIDPAAGVLTGTFAPGFPCGLSTALTASTRPVVGTVNGNAVAWTLSLPACPSVGTWVGHYQTVDAEEQLAMLWTLALAESPPAVGSTLTGSALFVRQTTP